MSSIFILMTKAMYLQYLNNKCYKKFSSLLASATVSYISSIFYKKCENSLMLELPSEPH